MTDELVREIERELSDHGAFERSNGGFAVTTTPFEATVTVDDGPDGVDFRVTVRVPTIDSAVEGEAVAPVVQEGWFETFERRLEDLDGALHSSVEAPIVSLRSSTVVVETGFQTSMPARGVSDAKALVDYVEGTYMEGIIPGYDYAEPVASLLARAAERSGAEDGRPPL